MTDPLTKVPYNKPLIEFSTLVVNMRIDGQESRADMMQYLINRCEKDEQRIALLESMLRELEWSSENYKGMGILPACPCCEELKIVGHAPDCRLKKLLEES